MLVRVVAIASPRGVAPREAPNAESALDECQLDAERVELVAVGEEQLAITIE